MVRNISAIPHRSLNYSTLKAMKKSELIEYIRCLENNWSAAMDLNEQQARNFEEFLHNITQFEPKY